MIHTFHVSDHRSSWQWLTLCPLFSLKHSLLLTSVTTLSLNPPRLWSPHLGLSLPPSHSVPPQASSLSNANEITALPLSPQSCSAVLWMTSGFLPCACQTQSARRCQVGSEASTWAPSPLSTGGLQPFDHAVPSASLTLCHFLPAAYLVPGPQPYLDPKRFRPSTGQT